MQKCVKGQEESAVRGWKAQHPSGREEAFFFTYDRLKRFEGVPAHAGPGFRGDASGFQD